MLQLKTQKHICNLEMNRGKPSSKLIKAGAGLETVWERVPISCDSRGKMRSYGTESVKLVLGNSGF